MTPADLWKRVSTAEGLAGWLGREPKISLSLDGALEVKIPSGERWAGRVVMADPLEALGFVLEEPELAYMELAWRADGPGVSVLVSGSSFGTPDTWPQQQRVLWKERLDLLES
jgi:hypothetical protein